jgi:hypothetical protein
MAGPIDSGSTFPWSRKRGVPVVRVPPKILRMIKNKKRS